MGSKARKNKAPVTHHRQQPEKTKSNRLDVCLRRVAARSRSRMQFFQYVEWRCRQQLASVQAAPKRAGMAIGLYKDMAVGIDPHGADASIGTPPELFSPNGQRWNLAPIYPRQIRMAGYRLFAECFRRTMKDSGIIRIDHAWGCSACSGFRKD